MRMLWVGLALVHFSICSVAVKAEVALPVIEQITLQSEPPAMRIQLDRPVPFRAVRVDTREVMIAFKGARLSEKLLKQGERGPLIREFTVERLPDNVVALMVATDQDAGEIQTSWDESVNTLTVRLFPANSERPMPRQAVKKESRKSKSLLSKPQPPVSKVVANDAALPPAEAKAAEKTKIPESQVAKPQTVSKVSELLDSSAGSQASPPSAPIVALQVSSASTQRVTGSEDDLLLTMDGAACPEQTKFQEAFRQCGKKNWREAFQLLNADLQSGLQNNCQEKEYYLRAYAYYKLNQQGDEGLYLEALSYFQGVLSYFPDSVYAPYALTSVGKIYKELKNYAEAKGYFKIILEKYKDYPGRPEVMFELGQIYGIEKNMKMSVPIFKDILANFPDTHFATDVKLELGKAFYNSNQYSQALEMLNDVLGKEPRKAFDLEDVLLVMGNSYYQLGKFQESRDTLIRAFNIFPNAEANPITLTRIGDILRDTGQPDKANKIYQIVMDRFTGTDGCVISAMRRAALIEERTEKESIYRKVISEYPKHPMASLAVVKLSDLQYKAGEYRNSIETLRSLFMANPKNLKAEVSYIIQASFKELLSELAKVDAYPEMVAVNQKEGQLLRRFEQPEIFRMLGLSHLKGHLYGEAAKLYEKADKNFGTDGPPDFYFEYGMALQESGNVQPALKKFQEYIQKAPQGEHVVPACVQIGRLMIHEKDANGAISALKMADTLSKAPSEKIDILRLTAEAHGLLGDLKTSARLLVELVNLLLSATEKNPDMLFDVYQQLGETYLKMKSNTEAANAFEMALKYSGKAEPPAVLVQLGEARQKAGQSELAIKIYNQVLALEDEFWKNVAKERLQGLQIENKIKTDGAKR
jgi:TolA-binding protein